MFKQARVTAYKKVRDLPGDTLDAVECAHPLKGFSGGYEFTVPLLPGDHVTDDTGTGFVHTAPGHGREDFDVWMANARDLEPRGINTAIPYTVDENGAFTDHAPGFTGKRVINDKGEKGDANEAVIKALVEAGKLLARGRLKHQYPHSWRSKKPVIFRNTPQWFIAMDKDIAVDGKAKPGDTLRARALHAISVTQWVPPAGQNRINGMIAGRPDWVISRQRAWGVPIAVFVREKGDGSAEILQDEIVNQRIVEAFMEEGADAWYMDGARERFLRDRADRGMEESRRHLRRLVRFRLDPRLRAGGPPELPQSRQHRPQDRWRRRYRDVSGRVGPASRLVSFLAAGKRRHPRPRAV